MENPSKNNSRKKVNEPETAYKAKSEIENQEDSDSVLNQLLEIGLKQCENWEIRTHDEVMAEMKRKFNWSFWFILLIGQSYRELLSKTKQLSL